MPDVYESALARLDAAFLSGFDSMMDGKTARESLVLLRALLMERQAQHSSMAVTKEMVQAGAATDAALAAFVGDTQIHD